MKKMRHLLIDQSLVQPIYRVWKIKSYHKIIQSINQAINQMIFMMNILKITKIWMMIKQANLICLEVNVLFVVHQLFQQQLLIHVMQVNKQIIYRTANQLTHVPCHPLLKSLNQHKQICHQPTNQMIHRARFQQVHPNLHPTTHPQHNPLISQSNHHLFIHANHLFWDLDLVLIQESHLQWPFRSTNQSINQPTLTM